VHSFGAASSPVLTRSRLLVGLGVFALHALTLAGLSLNLRPAPDMVGGAPVIQLTLAPRASFDGVNAPRTSAASPPAQSPPEETPDATPPSASDVTPLLPRRLSPTLANAETFAVQDRPAQPSSQQGTKTTRGAPTIGLASRPSEAGLTQGGGAPVVGAAAATTADAYEAVVLAWIERHKRHPGGAAGIVTVRFTLDRRGAVRASEVVTSSGARSVDYAALSQLRDASPFPRPAPNTTWRSRDFTVRIDFRALQLVS